jgi:hypothetical protein
MTTRRRKGEETTPASDTLASSSSKKSGGKSEETNKSATKPSTSLLQVRCRGEVAAVEESPATFADFDAWVRGRFGVGAGDAVKYSNTKTGHELIPNINIFTGNDVSIDVTVLPRPSSSSSSSSAAAAAKREADEDVFLLLNGALLLTVPSFLVLLTAACCMPGFGKSIDALLLSAGLPVSRSMRAVAVDLFVPFLCWAGPYLFVRRALNPENRGVIFQKYAADAFFGGLAASASVYLRPIFNHALQA